MNLSIRKQMMLELINSGIININEAKQILEMPSLPEPEYARQQLIKKDREYFERIYDAKLIWEAEGGRIQEEDGLPERTENEDGSVTLHYPAKEYKTIHNGRDLIAQTDIGNTKIYFLPESFWIQDEGGNPPFKIPDTEDEDLWWIGSDSKITEQDIKVWKKPEHCTCAIPDWVNVGVMSQLWHCKSCDRPKKEDK